MRKALRVVAGLNGVFQMIVGLLCTLAPDAAAKVFELGQTGPAILALTRMFGGLLFGSGLLSGLIARDPDRNPDLLVLASAACVANISADFIVVSSGELAFKHLAGGILIQVILVVLAIGHLRTRSR
jgi:hypothetical protein